MVRSTQSLHPGHHISKRLIVLNVAIFAAVLYLFGTQFGNVQASGTLLGQTDLMIFAVCLILVVLTVLLGTMSYFALTTPQASLGRTLLAQVASGFVNRLLPAGLGGLGLFAVHLKRCGYSVAGATAIVATNNILGFVGNLLLVGIVLLVVPIDDLTIGDVNGAQALYVIVSGLVVVIVLASVRSSKRLIRVQRLVRQTSRALLAALRPRPSTYAALLANMTLTGLNAVILCLAVSAVGGNIAWPYALLVLSFGTALGTAIPTPGGIGGVEAGLLGGLLASGVDATVALPAVLLYRILTYWLPIIPGIIAFRIFETNTTLRS